MAICAYAHSYMSTWASWWFSDKEPAYQCRRPEFDLRVGTIPWRRK